MSAISTTTWTVPRESTEWVGPITVLAKVNGVYVGVDPSVIMFALIPVGQRPASNQWVAPVVEPGGTGIGLQVGPVSTAQRLGIWVKFTDSSEIPVLDPGSVGHLIRS